MPSSSLYPARLYIAMVNPARRSSFPALLSTFDQDFDQEEWCRLMKEQLFAAPFKSPWGLALDEGNQEALVALAEHGIVLPRKYPPTKSSGKEAVPPPRLAASMINDLLDVFIKPPLGSNRKPLQARNDCLQRMMEPLLLCASKDPFLPSGYPLLSSLLSSSPAMLPWAARLLELGASPDAFEQMAQNTSECVLMHAAWDGLPHAVSCLLDAGANPNQVNPNGQTAAHYLMRSNGKRSRFYKDNPTKEQEGSLHCLNLLLAAGADIHGIRDKWGKSAMDAMKENADPRHALFLSRLLRDDLEAVLPVKDTHPPARPKTRM